MQLDTWGGATSAADYPDSLWQLDHMGRYFDQFSGHNSSNFTDAFYQQYDSLIDLYTEKFAKPGLALYQAAKPLLNPAQFSNPVDFNWYEIWHHEGRRARHGVSMMGPDYTHWHGTYEVAKHFYAKYIPELQELAEKHKDSTDAAKIKLDPLNKFLKEMGLGKVESLPSLKATRSSLPQETKVVVLDYQQG